MGKYKELSTKREPEPVDGLTEAEKIAKEIGGHIPERVVDEGILSGVKAVGKERRICN